MNAFSPASGDDILRQICKVGDDFKKQTPETRLAAYSLIHELMTNAEVSNVLQYNHGATCGFMVDLLQMCRSERNPTNLLRWFAILADFLQQYSPSADVTQEVFNTFSAYFPIMLNRQSEQETKITSEELKLALRGCFAAHHRVAKFAIPFLVTRLDQGDGVTVTVKVTTPKGPNLATR